MADQLLDNDQAAEIGRQAAMTFAMGAGIALDGADLTVTLLNGAGDGIASRTASLEGAVIASLSGLTWDDLTDQPDGEEVRDVHQG